MFGETVQFTFLGRGRSSSSVGIFFSCLTFTFFATFFAVRTIKFVSSDDPFIAMMDQGSEFEPFDLFENEFFFAIN